MNNFFIVTDMCIIFSDEDLSGLKDLFHAKGSSVMNYTEIENLVRTYLGDNFVMQPIGPEHEIDLQRLGHRPDSSWIDNPNRGKKAIGLKVR